MMGTKFTKPVTIDAPGKDIVFDGCDFSNEAHVIIEYASTVTIKNCRFFNLVGTAAPIQIKNAALLSVSNCYFGMPVDGDYDELIENFDSCNNEFCNNFVRSAAPLRLTNLSMEGLCRIIKINDNHFEKSAPAIIVSPKESPCVTIEAKRNTAKSYVGEYEGIVAIQPYGTETVSMNSVIVDLTGKYYLYAGKDDTQFSKKDNLPIVVINEKVVKTKDLTLAGDTVIDMPFDSIEWKTGFVPADTKVTRTTTGRVVIYDDGEVLDTKAEYAEQLPNWELVYDPEYLSVSTAPTAYSSYIGFVLKGVKAGETTIEYRNKEDETAKVSATIKIDHYLSIRIAPSGTHLVEAGAVEIDASSTFDGEAMNLDEYTFTSSDVSIATIDGTTISPLKAGSINVIATKKSDASVSATATVSFVAAAVKIDDTFYDTIKSALKAAKSGDTLVIQRDVVESVSFGGELPRVDGFALNIDLNGHTWTSNATQSYAFRCDYGIVTIKDSVGGGAISYGKDYALVVSHLAGDYVSKLIIEAGTFTGKTSVLQDGTAGGTGSNKKYYGGEVDILGGTFITVPDEGESYDDQGNFRYTLNMLDMNESAYPGGIYSPSVISVKGGTFQKFNPQNCAAEGPNTNFVAEGYAAVDNGDGSWTVKPVNE